jgi:hypothetical protein
MMNQGLKGAEQASEVAMLTSSWYAPRSADHQIIGISRGVPRRMAAGYRLYRALAPGEWFRTASTEEYLRLYHAEILAPLDPGEVWADLHRLAGGKVPVLVCYEQIDAGEWCHRGIIAKWFAETLGVDVGEYGHLDLGTGRNHSMLPAGLRLSGVPFQ